MKLSQSQLMTGGALAFAAFALWFIARKPAAVAPSRQAQEVAGFQEFMRRIGQQEGEFAAPVRFGTLFDGATLGG